MESLPYGREDVEAAIREFLGEHPRASEWKEWRKAIVLRLGQLKEERASLPPGSDTSELDAQIAEMEKYLAVLTEEAVITEFVEDSIRAAAAVPVEEGEEGEEEL